MAVLSEQQLNKIILAWRDKIEPSQAAIRRAQDEVLLDVGAENHMYVITAMSAILGKGNITMSNNVTNIGNAGVAVTGGSVTGNITGTAHHNLAATAPDAFDGLAKLRAAIDAATELDGTQKEDAHTAIEDIETEAKKPDGERKPGRVRNALSVVAQIAATAKGVHIAYQWAAPHIEALFHLAGR